PSTEKYVAALQRLDPKMSAIQRALLLALFRAPRHTTTARVLARAVGLKNWRAVNLRLGLLGSLLRAELRYRGDGQKSSVIASFLKPQARGKSKGEWLWTMHKPLVDAIRRRLAGSSSASARLHSFLLYGGSDEDNGDYSTLRRGAERRSSITSWSCLKDVKKGDELWFYVKSPVSAVVANGIAQLDAQSGRNWRYEVRVGNLAWIQPHITLNDLRSLFPDWDWVKTARGKVHLTEERADALRHFVATGPAAAGTKGSHSKGQESVLEGLGREAHSMRKSRNRGLRDAAIRDSRGVCKGCGTNYSKVLDGRAACVLEVHHRRQLALNTVPIVTRLQDLAVVCANCHAFIHADSQRALAVRNVRSLLPSGWGAE
ncbi:MAG TPA: hypothetical protein VF311_02455, partial [Terriglobales bacterium]